MTKGASQRPDDPLPVVDSPITQLSDLVVGERYDILVRSTAHNRECCVCDDIDSEMKADLIATDEQGARFEIPESQRDELFATRLTVIAGDGRFTIAEHELADLVLGISRQRYEQRYLVKLDRIARGMAPDPEDQPQIPMPIDADAWDPLVLHGSNLVFVWSGGVFGWDDVYYFEPAPNTLALFDRVATADEAELFGWPTLPGGGEPNGAEYPIGALVVPIAGPLAGQRCFVEESSFIRLAVVDDLDELGPSTREQHDTLDHMRAEAVDTMLERFALNGLLDPLKARPAEADIRSTFEEQSSTAAVRVHIQDLVSESGPHGELTITPGQLASFALAVIDDPAAVEKLVREATLDALD